MITNWNVVDFGAVGDGIAEDTAAVQRALDQAATTGGSVMVPPGVYSVDTLHLRSHVSLWLDTGAVLLSRTDSVLLHGERVEDVCIGGGVLEGRLIINQSRQICLRDTEVRNASDWAITFFGCQYVRVLGLHLIDSRKDGIDFVCCQNVLMDGACIERCCDDSICFKNEGEGYRYDTRPDCGFLTENVIVTNTVVSGSVKGHPAVKIGTGTAGVFRNIQVHHCVFDGMNSAFCIQVIRPTMPQETERIIENVHLSDIMVRNCRYFLDVTEMDVYVPTIRRLFLDNITVDGTAEISRIIGTAEAPVEQVSLRNITLGKQHLPAGDSFLRLEHVHRLTVDGWDARDAEDAILELDSCRDASVHAVAVSGDAPTVKISGADSARIFFDGDGVMESKQPLCLMEDVPTQAVSPRIGRFAVEALTAEESVPAGASLHGTIRVRNDGASGFCEIPVMAVGRTDAIATVRTWLYREETREIPFETEALYMADTYTVQAGDCGCSVSVFQTPARMHLEKTVAVRMEGEEILFDVTVQNLGGTVGSGSVSLLADGTAPDEVPYTLQPGCRAQLTLHGGVRPVNTVYRIEDLPTWEYRLAANTSIVCTTEENRITLTSGGRRYSDTGDDEKRNLREYAAVYRRVRGDFTATVQLLAQDRSGQYAWAGLIACNDMRHAERGEGAALLSNCPKYGSMGVWRADCDGDGETEMLDLCSTKIGFWFRLEKRGKNFTGSVSPDRENWVVCRTFCVETAAEEQDVGLFGYANSVTNGTGTAVFGDFTIEA